MRSHKVDLKRKSGQNCGENYKISFGRLENRKLTHFWQKIQYFLEKM